MKTSSWALGLLALALCAPFPCRTARGDAGPGEKRAIDELLLFWDEKDLYVESATRSEIPLSQVAENVTVVTAQEIRDLHAHTVAEVLNRLVTGVFVVFQGQDFGGPSNLLIQGANERHTLVLLDGVPWNSLGDNHAETLAIPIGIIDRIEVIKGPASSAWGSSLGGVVNILTKAPGPSPLPSGSVTASYGERNSQDYAAELTGAAGPLGYYLHAGYRESDGLRNDRQSQESDVYGKLRLPLWKDAVLGLTAGHSAADLHVFELPEQQISQTARSRPTFGTLSFEAGVAPGLRLSLSAYASRQESAAELKDTASGATLADRAFTDRTTGGTAKVVWATGPHILVAGTEFSHGEQTQDVANLSARPFVDRWAVFANDTWVKGNLSVTPGFRYDRNNISGAFPSPSLGATYRVGEHTVLRASVARGFTYPPLSFTSVGDGFFLVPNPRLKPEKVWSYQAGAETDLGGYAWLKTSVFYHRQTDAIERVLNAAGPDQDQMENVGHLDTKGVEVELETVPWHDLSLKAGAAYVDMDPVPDSISTGRSSYSVSLTYDDRTSWRAQWRGVYKNWLVEPDSGSRSNGAIWDFSLDKKVFSAGQTTAGLFFVAHNVFNASEYVLDLFPNPRRWVEGGVRLDF